MTCTTVPLSQQFSVRRRNTTVLVRLQTVLAPEHFVQETVNIPVREVQCQECLPLTSLASPHSHSVITLILVTFYCHSSL